MVVLLSIKTRHSAYMNKVVSDQRETPSITTLSIIRLSKVTLSIITRLRLSEWSALRDRFLASPTNIRLECKRLAVLNTLAYYNFCASKKFYSTVLRGLFFLILYCLTLCFLLWGSIVRTVSYPWPQTLD